MPMDSVALSEARTLVAKNGMTDFVPKTSRRSEHPITPLFLGDVRDFTAW